MGDVKYKKLNQTLTAIMDHVVVAALDVTDHKMHVLVNDSLTRATGAAAAALASATYITAINQTTNMLSNGCPVPKSATAPCGLAWNSKSWKQSAKKFEKILSKTLFPFALPVPNQQNSKNKWLLVGEPIFEATVRICSSAGIGSKNNNLFSGGGLVVSLYYAPPDHTHDGLGWFFTQGFQYFDHIDNDSVSRDGTTVCGKWCVVVVVVVVVVGYIFWMHVLF